MPCNFVIDSFFLIFHANLSQLASLETGDEVPKEVGGAVRYRGATLEYSEGFLRID